MTKKTSGTQTNTDTAPTTSETMPHWKRNVGFFLSGQTVSMFGSMLVQYAAMWYLTLETKSGVVLMLSAVLGMAPQAIVSLFGGVWADRHNRKLLIIGADAVIALSTLVLALLMLSGVNSVALILATMFIRSIGAGIQMPAASAFIPLITPTEHLIRVNGVFGSISSGMMLLAPAAAGAIYVAGDFSMILFIDVVTAVIGIGLLLLVPAVAVTRTEEQVGFFEDMRRGFVYLQSHTFIRWLLVVFAVVFVLTVAPSALTPLMVARTFGGEIWMLTVLELAFSIGMTLGGITLAVWGGLQNRTAMIVYTSVLFGALSIAMGFTTNIWIFFGLMFLVGLFVPMFSTPSMTLLQERVDPDYMGRVFGFFNIAMSLGMPVGMLLFGPWADITSVENVLVISGALMIVVILLALVVPSGRHAWEYGQKLKVSVDSDSV